MAEKRRTWTYWGPLNVGLGTFLGLALVVWFWGINTSISGAVIGNGQVLVSTNQTAVQHPKGGVVSAIFAENGDLVEAGQVLIRLDDTEIRSDLNSTEQQLLETLANEARLEAQIASEPTLDLPSLFQSIALRNDDAKLLVKKQQKQLDTHYSTLRVQSNLITQQAAQVQEQILGFQAELKAKEKHLELVAEELLNSEELRKKDLLKSSVMITQRKDQTRTEGEIGQLKARIAELRGKILELELKRLALEPELAQKASVELNRARVEKAKLTEKRLVLLDRLRNLEIRSPIAGRAHESQVQGLRSVIQAAKPVMYIVPDGQPLTIEVKVAADDIDQVGIGQGAQLRFSAFSKRKTPLIYGKVKNISPDALVDPKTKKPYYKAWITMAEGELEKLSEFDLVPGMPVTAFITTEERSPVTYVTRPIWQYLEKAFRDA